MPSKFTTYIYPSNAKTRLILWIILVCFLGKTNAQDSLKINQWAGFLPYLMGSYVTQNEKNVYYSSAYSLLKINKQDLSHTFISKVDGLNDVLTGPIKYHQDLGKLLITYQNGNIDLIENDGIVNLPNIKNNTNISGLKNINSITIIDQYALLCFNFGIVQLDMERDEFGFTTFTPFEVYDINVFNGSLYINTAKGVYTIPYNDNINFADFSQWTLLNDQTGIAVSKGYAVSVYKEKLYFSAGDTLYSLDKSGNIANVQSFGNQYYVKFLSAEGPNLLIGLYCKNECNGQVYVITPDGSLNQGGGFCVNRPVYALEEPNGRIWYGDGWDNIRYAESYGAWCSQISLEHDAPYSVSTIEIRPYNDKVYFSTGGWNHPSTTYRFNQVGTMVYNKKTQIWDRIYKDTDPAMNGSSDFSTVAVNPQNGKLYVGSYIEFLFEFNADGTFSKKYDTSNSSLQLSEDNRVRISSIAFDSKGNLWVVNPSAAKPLSVLKTDGTWQSFGFPDKQTLPLRLSIDQFDNKWLTMASAGINMGLIVFNEGDIADPTDDEYRNITTNNSQLQNNVVNCVTFDLDGSAWVGTNAGPVVFECGQSIFDNSCTGRRYKVDQNGIIGYLLEPEEIRTISIDGANRKWFGTTNGVFVQSADGLTQVYRFEEANSPLFSNRIQCIANDPFNGNVYIATEQGLNVIRNDATFGGEYMVKDSIRVYPNPVRPEYDGPIAIKGLARDSNVKITDMAGMLVYETKARGGQAIWNGKDLSGRKAATGVYLVFCTYTTNLENPGKAVAKILFIN